MLVVALVPLGAAATAAATRTPLFPDLETLPPRQLKLDRADVSIDGSGVLHNLLRFSNTVYNVGQGPLILNADIDPLTRSGPATQRVMNDDGTYAEYPASAFYWHEAHQHYHLDDWGSYELWTKADYDKWVATGRSKGQAKKVGAKTTSCVLDEEFVASLPGTPYPGQYYGGCLPIASGQLRQVLSVGWGDTYDYWRAEQWIDLDQETLADGQYVLRSVTDPKNIIYESSSKGDAAREGEVDNEGVTVFTVQGGALVDGAVPTGTVSINHVDASTQATAVIVDVLGRDDVSGVDQIRLSNDGVTWATYPYTSGDGSVPTTVAWDLADARYGGSTAGGDQTVYAQAHDRSGKWSSTFTDSINLVTGRVPPSSGYGGVVAADGPVGYWRLGEQSGIAAADSIGTNVGTYRNGVVLGATGLTTDTTDAAAAFDGVNDLVSVPSSSELSPSGGLTVEAWVRPAKKPSAGAFASVLTKADSYSLQFNGPQLEFTTIVGGTRRRAQAPAAAVVAGLTYHVVGTYDGGTQRLYVNGVQVASIPATGAVTANANPVLIGSWDGGGEFAAATIDDVAVYAKVLTAAQVTNHFTQGTAAPPPPPPPPPPASAYRAAIVADGPVVYWRLGEASGMAATDAIGANVGTYANGVALGAASLTSDATNPAATFDGVNDVMSVPSTSALSPTGALTVEAWVRPSVKPAAGGFASIVTKPEAYSLQFNGPQLEFTTINGATRRRVQAPAGSVVAGVAYHVVGTFDGSVQRLYVNGVQVASAHTPPPPTPTPGR